jgi:hypothetical protein
METAVAGTGDDHRFTHHLTDQMISGLRDLLDAAHAKPLVLEYPLLLQGEPFGRHISVAGQRGYHN